MDYLTQIWNEIDANTKATIFSTIIGTIIGVIIGAHITEKRQKRASRAEYVLATNYSLSGNISFNCRKEKSTRVLFWTSTQDEMRKVRIKPKKNIKWPHFPNKVDTKIAFDVKNLKKFSVKITYFANGFEYIDYWVGRLVNSDGNETSPSYKIATTGPLNFFEYIREFYLK